MYGTPQNLHMCLSEGGREGLSKADCGVNCLRHDEALLGLLAGGRQSVSHGLLTRLFGPLVATC